MDVVLLNAGPIPITKRNERMIQCFLQNYEFIAANMAYDEFQ